MANKKCKKCGKEYESDNEYEEYISESLCFECANQEELEAQFEY